jgi:hypothetical protein
MAKHKTSNNDLFSNFNAPIIDKVIPEKEKTETLENPNEVQPEETLQDSPSDPKPTINNVELMQFALPRAGRPKTLEGKYHIYTARIREDLYQYAQTRVGKDEEFQSVNDYINRLIAKDMLSNNNSN